MGVKSCAFTGHRPKSFPWGYDETVRDCVLLKKALAEQIRILAEQGVTEWLSGMALGVDIWAAEVVLRLKKKYSEMNLCCIIPCEGQERKWPSRSQEQYRSILEQADEITYVSHKYSQGCMQKRNRYMVDHASMVLAVYNGDRQSGTAMTLRYAYSCERELILIDPISRTVSHFRCKKHN